MGEGEAMLTVILLVIAAACFALATVGVRAKVDLVPLGLLAWALVPLLHAVHVG
jgi:hypothetical protein